MNRVHAQMASGEGLHDAARVIEAFATLFEGHCAAEEDLMIRTSYPQAAAHRRAHQDMFEHLDRLRGLVAARDVTAGTEVLQHLAAYLREHMLKADLAMAEHVVRGGPMARVA